MTEAVTTQIDEAQLEQFVGQVIGDLGATVSSALAHIGHRLGLYRAMADTGRLAPSELAARTGTHERYVREWLDNQAASGYVEYDPASNTYELPPEHAVVLTDETSPSFLAAGLGQMAAVWADTGRLEAAFRSGQGIGWHEHDPRLFGATEALFKPAYRTHLVDRWIPALEGIEDRLDGHAKVADVGCGHGASAILLAEAYPNATVRGFDYHQASIEAARRRAAESGLDGGSRISFEIAMADEYPIPEGGYDLICFFDCLHDFGDPMAAAAHAREALADDGTVMLVEIRSEDRTEQNLHPIGRLGYGMSAFVCTPHSLSQEGGYALGGQAGPAAIGDIFDQAGFTHFRRVAEAPIHQVLEARP